MYYLRLIHITQINHFQTIELQNYLHPGERILLKKILDVVDQCNTIRNFIQECTDSNSSKSTEGITAF